MGLLGFPGSSDGKESAWNTRDLGLIPGLGRHPPPEGGHGNPLQYSCLENPHGQRSLVGYCPGSHKELDMTEWLNKLGLLPLFAPGLLLVMCSVSQLCPTLCDPMNCSLLGFSVCVDFQARILGMDCHFLLNLAIIHEPHLSKVGKKKAHVLLNILALIELHSLWPFSSLQKSASMSFFFSLNFSFLFFSMYADDWKDKKKQISNS